MPDVMRRGGVIAEFSTGAELQRAAAALRDDGYVELETYSPYEIPGMGDTLALPRPTLPRIVLIIALCGAVAGYLIQWYTNAWDYPLNAGGRPAHAVPAFVLISFETMVLCGAAAAFFGVLWILGLPRPWHPLFELEGAERTVSDRYWIAIGAADPRYDRERSVAALSALRPLRVLDMPDEADA